jgi:ketosteroid isomerase-like protein
VHVLEQLAPHRLSIAEIVLRDTGKAMSRQNVEIVRRWIRAFEGDDDKAFCELTHAEIEWAPFEENHTVSHGLAGALRIRAGWLESWAGHAADIEDLIDAGEDVVACLHISARGRGSGVEVDVRLYGHFKVRDGKVAYLYEHQDRSAALKAVGLSE